MKFLGKKLLSEFHVFIFSVSELPYWLLVVSSGSWQIRSPLFSLSSFLFTLTTYLLSVMGNSGCFILKISYLTFIDSQIELDLEDEVGYFLECFLALFL